jgi:hypothetical protein
VNIILKKIRDDYDTDTTEKDEYDPKHLEMQNERIMQMNMFQKMR